MLKISVDCSQAAIKMRLEGKLAGPEVKEVAMCWLTAVDPNPNKPVVVDLTEVRFIDEAGKELLAEMHCRGVRFVAVDYMTRAVVGEIQRRRQVG